MIDQLRSPPNNKKIEEKLLGALIIEPDIFNLVDSILPAGANTFYSSHHQAIYKTIARLCKEKIQYDLVLLAEEVKKESIDVGRDILINVTGEAVTSALADKHAAKLAELYSKRIVIEQCNGAIQKIHDNKDLAETIGTLGKNISNITLGSSQPFASPINEIALNWWEDCLNDEGNDNGRVYTGFRDLDKIIALMPGTHFILGARTSMGKTSLAIQIAANVALTNKRPLLFTMEQTKESVAACYVSQISGVDRFAAMTNTLGEKDTKRVMDHANIWGSDSISNIGVYDKSWSAQEIRHKIIMERVHKPVDLVIIDFLHNMKPPSYMKREGHEWLRETTAELEEMANELKVSIITLAQLSRKVEGREDKRPMLSDIREGGEDNADIVAFLYRDEYYNADTDKPGIAEIIVDKNRHGKTGVIELEFVDYSTAFKDISYSSTQKSWTEIYD